MLTKKKDRRTERDTKSRKKNVGHSEKIDIIQRRATLKYHVEKADLTINNKFAALETKKDSEKATEKMVGRY